MNIKGDIDCFLWDPGFDAPGRRGGVAEIASTLSTMEVTVKPSLQGVWQGGGVEIFE